MPQYSVLVHGTNFTVRRWIVFRRRLAFYSTCYVEAASPVEAEALAISGLQDDPKILLASLTTPVLHAEEVRESNPSTSEQGTRTGLAFYVPKDQE
jgi:hypothetical protein